NCDFSHEQVAVSDLAFDPSVALVVVDVQNDFADPAGSLSVRGGEEVVRAVNRLIVAARAAHAAVAYTQDWHPPATPDFETDGGTWPVHCVADTSGAAFHPDRVVDGEIVSRATACGDAYSGS